MAHSSEEAAAATLALARAWVDALNRRDAEALRGLLHPDFRYCAMVRKPEEMAFRWDAKTFLGIVARGAGDMKKPVVMTVVSEMATADRAVLETEGYSERQDGFVYDNIYCLLFWVKDGQITAVHDYCCTHMAVLHVEHILKTSGAPVS